ncbi:hypothetical protein C8F01DRAFT_980902 [Mycena amicta]|nr:hypothetical protein C8F01DRAFT_980902 [Mycena amicta]
MAPHISNKKLERLRQGTLGSGALVPLPNFGHANKKPVRTTGSVILSANNRADVFFPGRSTRKSPSKSPSKKKTTDNLPTLDFDHAPPPGAGVKKRAAQYLNWMKIIPDLVPVYLSLLKETSSLRNTSALTVSAGEPCGCVKRTLALTVIRWLAIEEIEIEVCSCTSSQAPAVLLRGGLFACSPCNPTLAVDLQVLEFAMEHALNVAPNNTAFCKTLEKYLSKRGYQMPSGERLRIRFGNCYQWYTQLVPNISAVIDESAEAVDTPPPDTPPALPETPSHPGPSIPQAATGAKRRRAEVSDDVDDDEDPDLPPPNPFPEPPPRSRPSDYLVNRCPCCFSGLKHDETQVFDLAVCMDGNFTQKRRRRTGGDDPPRTHPETVFIPRSRAQQMEAHVDGVRDTHKPTGRKKRHTEPQEDGYEGHLKVPTSGLDACEASFKAADESREKASTKFFAETGLMGMVCRHDIVLFLVNMESAGEKQYYSLLLLEELFQHLPPDIVVGALYDVGCQLDRLCAKFDFLLRYKDRLVFAVSVFHVFAHIWACQLIYHPQKCLGFGGSNGEGSERVWFKLSHLISHLRVCGYHQRIFTIDMQVQRDTQEVNLGIAAWLRRRTIMFEERYREAHAIILASGRAEEWIQTKYDAQIAYQTRPLPKRSKTQAATAINNVLVADRTISLLEKQIDSMMRQLCQRDISFEEKLTLQENIERLRGSITKETTQRDKVVNQLGQADRNALKKMSWRDYYSARLGCCTLKERILQKLVQRKMELDPVERSVRRSTSDLKKNEHATAAIRKREPTIKKLVKSYNDEQAKIVKLIQKKKVPPNTIAPERLDEARIFKLDIDDAIWLDVGLTDDDSELPEALLDPEIRRLISYLLQKRRAEEELHRLKQEHGHLRHYLATEWEAMENAIDTCSDEAVLYQLQRRRHQLLDLHVVWLEALDALALGDDFASIGPTEAQLSQAHVARVVPAWRRTDDGDASDTESEDSSEDEEDPSLIGVLSTLETANRDGEDDEGDEDDVFN